jgi:hypothetical protein
MAERFVVGHSEYLLDHNRMGKADPESETSLAGRIGCQCLLRHRRRVPWIGGHHRCSQLDTLGDLPRERTDGDPVEPEDIRRPSRGEAVIFGLSGLFNCLRQVNGFPRKLSNTDTNFHPVPPGMDAPDHEMIYKPTEN